MRQKVSHHWFRLWLATCSVPAIIWPMLTSCQLDPREHISMKSYLKKKIVHENAFEDVVCKMEVILSRPQCVDAFCRIFGDTDVTKLSPCQRLACWAACTPYRVLDITCFISKRLLNVYLSVTSTNIHTTRDDNTSNTRLHVYTFFGLLIFLLKKKR